MHLNCVHFCIINRRHSTTKDEIYPRAVNLMSRSKSVCASSHRPRAAAVSLLIGELIRVSNYITSSNSSTQGTRLLLRVAATQDAHISTQIVLRTALEFIVNIVPRATCVVLQRCYWWFG